MQHWGMHGFGLLEVFLLGIGKVVREVVSGKVGMGTLYGYWFLLLGVGTMLEAYSLPISIEEEWK